MRTTVALCIQTLQKLNNNRVNILHCTRVYMWCLFLGTVIWDFYLLIFAVSRSCVLNLTFAQNRLK